ncbi:MAG: hypothetical protein GY795_21400 [Desulfobacterales bacterium]|nr:hypothetical protein [Desulfobacterales bacterium]
MKKKIAYWGIIVFFIILFFLQNKDFIVAKSTVSFNPISVTLFADTWGLTFFKDYKTELRNIWLLLIAFTSGWVLTWFYNFLIRLKTGKTIRELNRMANSQAEKILALEKELEELQESSPYAQKEMIDISEEEEKKE